MDYSSIITIVPGRRSGKACIRDTRITVYDVLDYLASGMSEYPRVILCGQLPLHIRCLIAGSHPQSIFSMIW